MIQISRVDNVRLRRPAEDPCDVTVAITGHHLIMSIQETETQTDEKREIWLLHRNLHSVLRGSEGSRSGTLTLKYKDLRSFYLDIIGPDKVAAVATTLEDLSGVEDPTSSYPFFYNPGFKPLTDGWYLFRPEEEYAALIQGSEGTWRTSRANNKYDLSSGYGRLVIVPAEISDGQLLVCARHRVGGRFPVLACLHKDVPLVRASQAISPAKRCSEDEKMLAAVIGDRKRGFILDLVDRSLANKSSDLDCGYPHWKRVMTKVPSLAELRDSLTGVSSVCNDMVNSDKWLSKLATTKWLSYVKDILNTACLAAQCLEKDSVPVMVVENTGCDLSLVVSSLAQIILNPDTRTLHGFEALIEREWVQAGHPFWTRHGPSGSQKQSQQAPVFLLFLDCVHQIYTQFPCSFEFTDCLLVVLADHSLASNFGTFLCDSEVVRAELGVKEHTVSLWSYLNQVEILSQHLNCLYLPNKVVIWPSVAPMSLFLWEGYFLRWVQHKAVLAGAKERRRMGEIIHRNKEAQGVALRLRKELRELMVEAVELGVLEDVQKTEDVQQDQDILDQQT